MTPREAAHFQILRILETNPNVSQRELADRLNLSLGKANYLVNALISKGAIKIQNFRRTDKKMRKVAYILTPAGLSERIRLTKDYLMQKRAEYESLRHEIDSLQESQLLHENDQRIREV